MQTPCAARSPTCRAAGASGDAHPAALHLDGRRGRLWALYSSGWLEAWDLYNFRGVGQWQLRGPRIGGFRACGLCAESQDRLLLVGTDNVVGPRMLRMEGLERSRLQDGEAGNGGSKVVLPKSGSTH